MRSTSSLLRSLSLSRYSNNLPYKNCPFRAEFISSDQLVSARMTNMYNSKASLSSTPERAHMTGKSEDFMDDAESSLISPFLSVYKLQQIIKDKEKCLPIGCCLIEPVELAKLLFDSDKYPEIVEKFNIRVLDVSWLGLKQFEGRDPAEEFEGIGRIPTALRLDIDACADWAEPKLKHMLPTEKRLFSYLNLLYGTTSETEEITRSSAEKQLFVLYDSVGLLSSARVWWMLRIAFSFPFVVVLNGGLPNWVYQQFPVEVGKWDHPMNLATDALKTFVASKEAEVSSMLSTLSSPCKSSPEVFGSAVFDYTSVKREIVNKNSPNITLLDARPEPRFNGTAPESRADIQSGHIPNSINLPVSRCLQVTQIDSSDKTNNGTKVPWNCFTSLKSPEELKATISVIFPELLNSPNIPGDKTIVCSCASGVSATGLFMAMHIAGVPVDQLRVYDGSWSEYYLKSNRQL